ncbi:MAG: phage portal protein, partial [Gammaproteobacteria bacterium]|nr:phage portal protein [Gammaproteobacteria bacterium]
NEIPHPWDEERGDMISYLDTTAKRNSTHGLCINKTANCTVNLGYTVVEGDEKQIRERLSLVNDKGQSFEDVIMQVDMDYETNGNGYLELVPGAGGKVEELYFCPSIQTYLQPSTEDTQFLYRPITGSEVLFYRFGPTMKERMLVHFLQPTPSSKYYGMPPWIGVIPEIELDYYATLYNQKFFINSGVPDLVIVVEGGELDEPTQKLVQEFLQNNFKGLDNSQRTLYMPINQEGVTVKFEKLAMEKEKDGSFTKLRESNRDRIISAHGVPPRLAGVVTAGQLGGGGELSGQMSIFQETTIAPKQRYFEYKVNLVIAAMGINGSIKFNSLNTSTQEKNSEYYPKMVDSGILTIDESREEIGKEPMEEEDKVPDNTNEDVIEKLKNIRKEL